jgi:hypothetical protein
MQSTTKIEMSVQATRVWTFQFRETLSRLMGGRPVIKFLTQGPDISFAAERAPLGGTSCDPMSSRVEKHWRSRNPGDRGRPVRQSLG